MTSRVLPFVPHTSYQLFHAAYNVSSLLFFPNRIIYPLLTMPTPFEKEMERLYKLLAEVETDEDSENFSDHENFSEYDAESEEDGNSGKEEVNNTEWFSLKDGVKWRKKN
ncbi:hypothetical protein AVEN_227778-1 [Araneus ventricosus]|uniref:Uncharacterized protein n=1 Tax=Araneus ventricosus TaxID=182803 RepID=A0A4Y2IV40_ARAVE|nr:hypothetical protein AVEN_227778-1 [Araneus ventricosus]